MDINEARRIIAEHKAEQDKRNFDKAVIMRPRDFDGKVLGEFRFPGNEQANDQLLAAALWLLEQYDTDEGGA